jgi:L-lactate dehydrogenase complex protein LldG
MNSLRQLFEQRLTQAGGSVATPADLDALLTGKVFVSAHPVCRPWAARATCQDPREADVALTGCDAMVAETGSVAVFSGPVEGRLSTLTAATHVVLGGEAQLAPDMETVFERFADRLRPGESSASLMFITGPSRTTDIEKTLVLGVHGPKKLVCVFVGDDGRAV